MTNSRQIIDDQCYSHFITFNVYHRRRLLDFDHPKRILLGVLNEQLVNFNATCVGFVVMPDHVHSIIWFPETGQLSRFIHGWKRMSSFRIREWYRRESPEYCREFGEGEHFWQPKYHSFEIYKAETQKSKLLYMHANPVRAGIVNRATDWPWSSAGWYEDRTPVGVPIAWVD